MWALGAVPALNHASQNSINITGLPKNQKVTLNDLCNSETSEAQLHTYLTVNKGGLNIKAVNVLSYANIRNSALTVSLSPQAGLSFLC